MRYEEWVAIALCPDEHAVIFELGRNKKVGHFYDYGI